MKISLTITREDGSYVQYGERAGGAADDRNLIVFDAMLQHAIGTLTKLRGDVSRGRLPQWKPAEPTSAEEAAALAHVRAALEDELLEGPQTREVPVDEPATPTVAFYTSSEEPVTLDDDARLDELRAGNLDVDPADFEYDEARREDVQAEEGDLNGDPLMPLGDDLPATPESGETIADRAVRTPRTRPGRGRAVKDSPQA